MSQEIEDLVKQLMGQGWGYIPVDSQITGDAKDAAKRFIESFEHKHHGWALTRPGENGPDVGVIDKAGKDIKTYLHLAHDMSRLAHGKPLTGQQRECLRVMDKCRNQLEALGCSIASAIDEQLEDMSFAHLMRQASKSDIPYNVPTLRFLSYPDVFEQKGACPHYDRSTITMHLGDSGGELYVQNESGNWERASPPQGSALVFFGVKILELTGGRLKPCYHKSTTVRGKERTAAVMFLHADISHPVPDAAAEYQRFNSL